MPFSLTIEIDGLPPMTNPSGRPTHWAIKAKEAKKWKGLVAEQIRRAGPCPHPHTRPPWKRARLICTRFSAVSPDSDGLVSGFKHSIDGLVEAGILVNDKVVNIGMPDYRWERVPPGKGRIQIVVIPIAEEQGALL